MPFIDRRLLAMVGAALSLLGAGTNATAQTKVKHSSPPTAHALVLKFEGSPEAFDAALKRNFAIRARELGVDPALYADELNQIHDIVATCMTVTPSDWAAAQTAFKSEMRYVARNGGLNPVIRRIERLKSCDGGKGEVAYFGEVISDPSRPRKLGVTRSMSTFNGNGEQIPTPYFSISVSFYGLAEDKARWTLTSMSEIPEHYEVIEAKIPRPADQMASAASLAITPTDCVKAINRIRDFGLEYLVFQNTCDQPYRVNAKTRSGQVITAVVAKGAPVRLTAIVSTTGGFNGNYSVDAP